MVGIRLTGEGLVANTSEVELFQGLDLGISKFEFLLASAQNRL